MPEYVEIACLGDSIANGFFDKTGKGWVMRLVEKLNAQKPYGYYLNNFARSGNRSSDAFHELCHNVISMRPNVLLISIGTNDLIRRNGPDNALHLSDALREEYWIKILDVAKINIQKIFVFGLIPVDEKTMPFLKTDWSFNPDIQKYNQFCQKSALNTIYPL